MHITIALDTDQLTDRDRRVLTALVSDDTTPLVLPRVDAAPAPDPTPAGPPSPTPAPPAFMERLGQAVGQFTRSPGAATEARLPFAEQAGVRTRSTMPEDDAPPVDVVDAGAELEADLVERMGSATLGPNSERGDADMRVPRDAVVQPAPEPSTVPRELVDGDPAPHPQDRVRAAILGTVDAPVRHTSP